MDELAPPEGELSAPISREAQTEGSNPSGFAAGGSTTSPCRGGNAKRAQYTSKWVYCALDRIGQGKAYSVVFTD